MNQLKVKKINTHLFLLNRQNKDKMSPIYLNIYMVHYVIQDCIKQTYLSNVTLRHSTLCPPETVNRREVDMYLYIHICMNVYVYRYVKHP